MALLLFTIKEQWKYVLGCVLQSWSLRAYFYLFSYSGRIRLSTILPDCFILKEIKSRKEFLYPPSVDYHGTEILWVPKSSTNKCRVDFFFPPQSIRSNYIAVSWYFFIWDAILNHRCNQRGLSFIGMGEKKRVKFNADCRCWTFHLKSHKYSCKTVPSEKNKSHFLWWTTPLWLKSRATVVASDKFYIFIFFYSKLWLMNVFWRVFCYT